MRDVTEWVQGTRVSGRDSIQVPPGQPDPEASMHNIGIGRNDPGDAAVEGGTRGIEWPADVEGSGSTQLACDARFPGLPPAEDGIFVVDVESGRVLGALPSVAQKTGPAINGKSLHSVDPGGHVRTIGSRISDITPYSLRRARLRDLATANRRKDEFLAVLSHELRNPLAAINNGIRLLSHQAQYTPAWQKTQAMIERQVQRMRQLVDDLLDVTRINQGRLHLELERIDLREVVSNAIETVESDINERHHRLTTELPDTPVWLQADPGRLEQVFVNLLANASRYTDTGGELMVWMHTRDGQVIVRVRDSGIGIAPEVLPHVFDLFRQADEACPRSKSGLGVGLALVRDLVESHGGSVIGASAGLGRGSEFTVRLPRET